MNNQTQGIPGKKVLPILAVGCLVFMAVGFGGTYGLAKLWEATVQKNSKAVRAQAQKEVEKKEDATQKAPLGTEQR